MKTRLTNDSVNTLLIRLSDQGAYLIFGLSGWGLIRGWALITFSPFSVSKKFIL